MRSLSELISRRPRPAAKPVERETPPAPPKASTAPPDKPRPTVVKESTEEEDRRTLFEAGTLRKLEENASLVDRSSDSDAQRWHLVLSGSLRIAWVDGDQAGSTVLKEGQWLGPSADAAWASEAVAAEPCRVLEFGRTAFDQLPPKLQLDAYRSLSEALGDGNRVLRAGRASLELQVEATRHRLTRKRDKYLASPIVREFLGCIPRLPPHAGDLITRLMDDSSRVSEIVECVKQDPSLAGMVLRNANSAGMARAYKISDIQRACLHIGHAGVYRLVVQSTLETMAFGPEAAGIQAHSHLVSVIAYETGLVARQNAQLAATIGLMHDVGRSAGAYMRHRKHRTAWIVDLVDTAGLGARMLESWELPSKIIAIVERQDIPEFAPPAAVEPEFRKDVAVLHVAHLAGQYLEGELEEAHRPFAREYLLELGLKHESIEQFADDWIVPKLSKERRLPDSIRSVLKEARAR